MGCVTRLLINPHSSSPLLDLRHRTLDPNSVFSLRTANTKSKGRVSCLFSGNQREEQARKALESALDGKKHEFDKWDQEIKKRQESGGGNGGNGGGGGGGWFGGGGGWFSGDHFWKEAQQITITLLAILVVYLLVAKGEVMAALVLNPLLNALRGTRQGLTSLSSKLLGRKVSVDHSEEPWKKEGFSNVSAKESVVRKWGSD
ncbi:unnamed protein product [Microthlaspi erraticum]|uniref:Uncharacterized protein n=1 Tax=Microthlaspi erraticum TaxID=1685480 RepID=A0A6D2KQD3_9BRAS|nr:unnamed protein product [Microthlaspi erraticum]